MVLLSSVVDERRQTFSQQRKSQVCDDQRCDAATGLARLPAAQALLVCGFSTVTGHLVTPPARHRTVIPRCGDHLWL
jgi:hypothetical protein